MSIGIPIKLLHEAESHVITVELKSGEVYIFPSSPNVCVHLHIFALFVYFCSYLMLFPRMEP